MPALLLAVALLTRLPLRATRTDRPTAGAAMAWAPLVGAALGAVAVGVIAVTRAAAGEHATLLAAALAVASLVAITGALHLDGLADTADAFGVRGDEAAARAAARQSTVGVFGLAAVVVTIVVDVAAVATATASGRAATALVTGAGAGRLAATWACRKAPAARPEGLGAWVAGTVTRRGAMTSTLALGVVVASVAAAEPGRRAIAAAAAVVTATIALLAGLGIGRASCRRFGGLTGDGLGATISCTSTTAYVVVALAARSLH